MGEICIDNKIAAQMPNQLNYIKNLLSQYL